MEVYDVSDGRRRRLSSIETNYSLRTNTSHAACVISRNANVGISSCRIFTGNQKNSKFWAGSVQVLHICYHIAVLLSVNLYSYNATVGLLPSSSVATT